GQRELGRAVEEDFHRTWGAIASPRRLQRESAVGGGVFREPFLLDAALDAVAGDGVEAVDEEHAVEMVDLVLEYARAQAAGGDSHRASLEVVRLELHPLGARDVGEDPGQREAALLGRHGAA